MPKPHDHRYPAPEGFDHQTAEKFLAKLCHDLELGPQPDLDAAITRIEERLKYAAEHALDAVRMEKDLVLCGQIARGEVDSKGLREGIDYHSFAVGAVCGLKERYEQVFSALDGELVFDTLPDMRLQEYQVRAAQLSLFPDSSDPRRIYNVALGLCGETAELLAATPECILEEAGDLLWYVAEGFTYFNASIEDYVTMNYSTPLDCRQFHGDLKDVRGVAGAFADVVKKFMCGTELRTGDALHCLKNILHAVIRYSGEHGHSIREVAAANIRKLEKRYDKKTTYPV